MPDAFRTAIDMLGEYWWIITPVTLFFIFLDLRLHYIRTKYIQSINWLLLEIKIPKEVQKSPKAMEQIFAGLHGAKENPNLIEKWIKGEVPNLFSLEIIGKGGMVHFFIRTPEKFRNLVEAQVYAQYPAAEITEAEDYTKMLPSKIPSNDYNAWGTELVLTKADAYPIRTYPYFFEDASKEEEKIDPLASFSEILSHLSSNEHIWIQILIAPTDDKWKEEGEKLVGKLIGRKTESTKKGLVFEETHNWFEAIRESLHELFFGPLPEKKEHKKEERLVESLMLYLTPGQRDVVSSIENNISKLGFETVVRFIYWAKADIFTKANKAAILGAFKQFNTQNLNGFESNKKIKTSIDYFFKKRREFLRKVRVINKYKNRHFPFKRSRSKSFVFNTEELATIYHIPGRVVEAPTMPRIEAKKGSPPTGLPIEQNE